MWYCQFPTRVDACTTISSGLSIQESSTVHIHAERRSFCRFGAAEVTRRWYIYFRKKSRETRRTGGLNFKTAWDGFQIIVSVNCVFVLSWYEFKFQKNHHGWLKESKLMQRIVTYIISLIFPCQVYYVLTHWGRDKMAANFLTTFSNAFSWRKIYINFDLDFIEICSQVSS